MKYDPDAVEGEKPRGAQYVSRKDVQLAVVILIVLAVIFYPMWLRMQKQGMETMCRANIQQISKALEGYATLNDDRFPPVYDEVEDRKPRLESGVPYIWATIIQNQMSSRHNLGCPAATPEEHCLFYSISKGGPDSLAFGMYRAAAAKPSYQIPNLSSTVVITETNNYGSGKSYDPRKFVYADGSELKNDGFLVGWDNDNGNVQPSAGTEFVTRLAFRNVELTASGLDFSKVEARHQKGIHVIYADGHLGYLSPSQMAVKMLADRPTGTWRTD